MEKKEYSIEVGGKKLTAQFNNLADQTNGSVFITYGNTTILATAVMSKFEGSSPFFPLTVDYEEKFYATGKILGSRYMRREGRPSDEAILSGRIVDRTIRPLFKQHIRHDIQVVITVLSIDEDDPDVLGVIGASLALGTSDIPWSGPVSAVRVSKNGNEDLYINPTYSIRDKEDSVFEVLACGKDEKINMIETNSKEISEDETGNALEKANQEIEKIQKWQKDIIKEIGKEKAEIPEPEIPQKTKDLFESNIEPILDEYIFSGPGKSELGKLEFKWKTIFLDTYPEGDWSLASELLESRIDEIIHREALENERRADGRKLDEVRPLFAQAGEISSILHGSGVFYRGGTHILSALTLGGPGDSQVVEGMETQENKRFMHHYNFPPYSTGETGRIGGTNRRMIGHGALAEKALEPVIPSQEEFPYTIRIVSEALASNGSTSMGSVCGSTLALMDAGVPIKRPVAGIASGLMMKDEKNYKLLTDIQGPEDHHGDMDFKVAGTREGITAIQMDVKVEGIPIPILKEALQKAKKARLQILDVIEKAIPEPRKDISPNAPKIKVIKINPEKIGSVIGSGGKTINEIKDKTLTEIDIEDDGTVYITGKADAPEKALQIIEAMTKEFKKGDRIDAEIIKIVDFGAFAKLNPFTEGLIHVSEIAPFRINEVSDVLKIGQKVPVVVKEVDENGRLKLSIKEADSNFIKKS